MLPNYYELIIVNMRIIMYVTFQLMTDDRRLQ